MPSMSRRAFLATSLAFTSLAAACAQRESRTRTSTRNAPSLYPNETPELRAKINKWADHYDVPRDLVQRVVIRESTHRPGARNGPYFGLMQIHPRTARGMGYNGPANGLLNADTNLQYAVKYLRGAWMVSDGSYDKAVHWYASGYYYEAKRRGLLVETGLKS
ncbi:MAG: lytic transglycosylase domain-containing protein [Rhodobacteraceae bacterium]|nr:lytic transglycosylase domain-containing protein [Paracoccaceae bacterium]